MHVLDYRSSTLISIWLSSQLTQDIDEISIFFLRFLMVATTLLSLPSSHKFFHGLKDFIHSPEVLIEEMVEVHFEEPMIPLVFLHSPVPARLPIAQNLCTLPLPIRLFNSLTAFLCIDPLQFHNAKIVILSHVFLSFIDKVAQKVIAWRLSLVNMELSEIYSGLSL